MAWVMKPGQQAVNAFRSRFRVAVSLLTSAGWMAFSV
jgi:hypothetical protein